MERLSIDEVIEHCKRQTNKVEKRISETILESGSMDYPGMKQYWEHRQVAEWLEELKAYRAGESQNNYWNSLLQIGQSVYIISRGVIVPIQICSIIIDENGLRYSGQNIEHYGYGTITLYPDKRCVEWYLTTAEAEFVLNLLE